MVGSHKILTVSYGTFSCTLEGFEDSFETMKAIAEYFRDLAAEDRYFGAEPPQPDAEMLARIAEREIARRVEARMEASGIVLRVGQALDTPPPAAAAAPMATPAAAPAPAVQVMPPAAEAAPVTHPASPETVAAKLQRIRSVVGKGAAPAAVTPPPVDDAEEMDAPLAIDTTAMPAMDLMATLPEAAPVADLPVAEPVAEVAAPAVAAVEATPVAEPVAEVAAPIVAADEADLIAETVAEVAAPIVAEIVAEPAADLPADPVAEIVAEAVAALAVEPETAAAMPVAEIPATEEPVSADSVAEAPMPVAAPAVEPVAHAPLADTALDLDLAEQVASDETAPETAADEAPASAKIPAPDEAGSDEAAPKAAPVMAPVSAEDTPDPVAETAPAPLAAAPEPAAPPLRARVVRIRKADFDRAVATGAIVADPAEMLARADDGDLAADLPDPSDLADLAALDAPAPTLSPDDEADLLAELAAVESGLDLDTPVADIAEEMAQDLTDDLDAELAAIVAEADDDRTPGHAEDLLPPVEDDMLADIMRAVEEPAPAARIDADDDLGALDAGHDLPASVITRTDLSEPPAMTAADEDMDEDEDMDAPLPARARFAAPEEDEAALDRLMSQTDAQMSGPDAARRREAIAQLRAAVAATEAARALGETPKAPAATEDSFREDLRQAVRPRRPVSAAQAEARAERPRPAPLKLVASQRIDLPAEPAAPAAGPIRPRRVTLDQIRDAAPATREAAANADSFTDFAERMGATSLADLLEAAAAYTAFVEGSEDFSRPQILKKVNQLSPDTSREDGLRSFGTLLREGRFRRSPRAGRFEVAEDSRFNPDRHAV